MPPVVERAPVDLVREDHERVLARDGGDALHGLGLEHGAGRVVRRVEDQQFRARRDLALQILQVQVEAVLIAERQRHGPRAEEVDQRLVDRERRVGEQHVVAVLEQRHHGVEHDGLAAGRDHDVVGVARDAALGLPLLGDDLAELGQSGRRPVVRPALLQGLRRGVADVLRRIEVGLADLEVDDLPSLRLERPSPRQHFEGGFGPQPAHALRESHVFPPPFLHARRQRVRARRVQSSVHCGREAPVRASPPAFVARLSAA